MIALLQRVRYARVEVEGYEIAAINAGVCALVAASRGDQPANAERLARRVLAYRLFGDASGRMNLSTTDVGGGVLAVPQFTLAADTSSGNRAGFGNAAEPEAARELFDAFVATLAAHHAPVASGRFGADMQVEMINDGPVTFWIEG